LPAQKKKVWDEHDLKTYKREGERKMIRKPNCTHEGNGTESQTKTKAQKSKE